MSELKDLVPPLDLCKKIPAGEFQDSALVRSIDSVGTVVLCERENAIHTEGWQTIPAPTLQELIVALSDISISSIKVCKSFNEWHVECCIPIEYGERFVSEDSSKNAATAAVKLWLKLKGIEG